MEWKQFTESTKQFPEVIVEGAFEGFSNATNNLVHISIAEKHFRARVNSNLNNRFQFECVLFSKSLSDYSFVVFELGYDVEIFPVNVIIEQSIYSELANKSLISYDRIEKVNSEDKLLRIVELIFKSDRFTEIVSGIMKIAKKNEQDELPF